MVIRRVIRVFTLKSPTKNKINLQTTELTITEKDLMRNLTLKVSKLIRK